MIWAVSFVLSAVLAYGNVQTLSPDGQFFTLRPHIRPYSMRWFLPWLLKDRYWAWKAVNWSATAVTAGMIGLKCGSPWYSAIALGLPVFRQTFKFPVLTDPMGLLFLSGAFYTGKWEIAALGGLFNEKTPIFGAFLTSPLALVGLLPPFALYLGGKRPLQSDPEWLHKPFLAASKIRQRILDPKVAILPWGGALLGLVSLSPLHWAGVLLSYLQLLVAQDGPRLFQWSALPIINAVPPQQAPLAALLCWINPERDRL